MKHLAGLALALALGLGSAAFGAAQAAPFPGMADVVKADVGSTGAIPAQYVVGVPQNNQGGGPNVGGGVYRSNPGYVGDGYYRPRERYYRPEPRYRRNYYYGRTYYGGPYYGGPYYGGTVYADDYYYPAPRVRGRGKAVRDPAGGGTLR